MIEFDRCRHTERQKDSVGEAAASSDLYHSGKV